jgi:hypothetical protein
LSECAALHPDPEESESDQHPEGEWITADNFEGELGHDDEGTRMAALEHLETVFGISTRPPIVSNPQFEDSKDEDMELER